MRCFVALVLLPLLGSSASAFAATLVVNTLDDNGNGICTHVPLSCTLRDAIAGAAPGDQIVFHLAVESFPLPDKLVLQQGELLIYKNLSIIGPGAGSIVIDGGGQTRLFEITGNATVSIAGLGLANGKVVGANGIDDPYGNGTTGAPAYGGAILVNNGSILQLSNCLLNGNVAAGGAGGSVAGSPTAIAHAGNGGDGIGGALYSAGTLFVDTCQFVGNSAMGGAGGQIGFAPAEQGSTAGNGGGARGGAISADGPTEIGNSLFLQNEAGAGNGGGALLTPGGTGGSASGGALALSNFASLSFVSGVENAVFGGLGSAGSPPGLDGISAGADVGSDATVLSRYTVLTSLSPNLGVGGGIAGPCAIAASSTQGANFSIDNSCAGYTLHGDAKLQVLTSGGQTFAYPLWGSPLIDAAADCNDAFGNTVTIDVRGVARPLDGKDDGGAACDLGAVESDELFANGFE